MNTPNLNKALGKAIEAVSGVIKTKFYEVAGKKVFYADAEAIIEEARDALTANGITVIPLHLELCLSDTVETYPIGAVLGAPKEQPTVAMSQVKMVKAVPKIKRKYLLSHTSGESVECYQEAAIYDDGKRGTDKGVSAADTTSLAYFLRDALLMPRLTKEEFEAREKRDKEGDFSEAPKPKKAEATTQAAKPAAPAATQAQTSTPTQSAPAREPESMGEQLAQEFERQQKQMAPATQAPAASAPATTPQAKPATAPAASSAAPQAAPAATAPAPAATPAGAAKPSALDPAMKKRQDNFLILVDQILTFHKEQGVPVADFEAAFNKAAGGDTVLLKAGRFGARSALTETAMVNVESSVVSVKDKSGKATFGLSTLLPAGASA